MTADDFVARARQWIGTPRLLGQHVEGAGADGLFPLRILGRPVPPSYRTTMAADLTDLMRAYFGDPKRTNPALGDIVGYRRPGSRVGFDQLGVVSSVRPRRMVCCSPAKIVETEIPAGAVFWRFDG